MSHDDTTLLCWIWEKIILGRFAKGDDALDLFVFETLQIRPYEV
jgi:hypothetical protein